MASTPDRRPFSPHATGTSSATPQATLQSPAPAGDVRYSGEPASTINLAALTPSRFLLQQERELPYRDAEGRVNLDLVKQSLQSARESESVDSAVVARLEKWQRHAERALGTAGNPPTAAAATAASPHRASRRATPISASRLLESGASSSAAAASRPRLSRRLSMDDDGAAEDDDDAEEIPLSLQRPRRGREERDDDDDGDATAGAAAGSPSVKRARTAAAHGGSPARATPQRRGSSQPVSPMVSYALADRELHPRQADPYAVAKDASGSSSGSEDVYEVQQVLKEGERGFLIRWAGYSADHDSWEPEENISAALVAEFRRRAAEAAQYAGVDYNRGGEPRFWCRACREHSHPDNFSQQMRGTPEARRTCLRHHGEKTTPTPPRAVAPISLSEAQVARCRKFGFAAW